MKIVHEVEIDMRWPWWKRRKASLWKTGRRQWRIFLWAGLLWLIAFFIYLMDGDSFVLAIACSIIVMLVGGVLFGWLSHRHANKAAIKRLGPILTQFVEFTTEGIAVGTRYCSKIHVHWDLCQIAWHESHLQAIVGNMLIPLSLDALDPQHVEQIRFWSTRHQDKHDVCRHCRYNLIGSPGPACPECGKPIRILDLADGSPDA